MGIFKDLFHVAGNVVAVNQLTAEVRKLLLAEIEIDIERLPAPLRGSIHERIKQEFLNGNQSASKIATSLKLELIGVKWSALSQIEKNQRIGTVGQALTASGELIVESYRKLGSQLELAPTSRTTDDEIIETYKNVGSEFKKIASLRGERLSADILGGIVFKFLQVKEKLGKDFEKEHLDYELQLYHREGLRDEYKKGINLMRVLGLDEDEQE
jgi:hypothetical protein